MSEIPKDVYAFPFQSDAHGAFCPGMSLRDWFAGQALVGLSTRPNATGDVFSPMTATVAYRIADAMLEARK